MDTTPTDELISKLSNIDPAEAPDVADRLADELAAVLETPEPTEAEEGDEEDH